MPLCLFMAHQCLVSCAVQVPQLRNNIAGGEKFGKSSIFKRCRKAYVHRKQGFFILRRRDLRGYSFLEVFSVVSGGERVHRFNCSLALPT